MGTYRTCPNGSCANNGVTFDADEENNFCGRCGHSLVELEENDDDYSEIDFEDLGEEK